MLAKKLMQEMQEQTICLFALKRSNSKEKLAKIGASADLQIEKTGRNCLFTVKRSVKCRKSTLPKAFRGLCTRLVNKVLAYNLCIALNSIFGETWNLENQRTDILKNLVTVQ